MTVTLEVIPERFRVFASAYRTVCLSLYAMDCDRMTRSMSLYESLRPLLGKLQIKTHPNGKYNFVS